VHGVDEPRRRVNEAGRTHGEEREAFARREDERLDLRERRAIDRLAEPHDVGAQQRVLSGAVAHAAHRRDAGAVRGAVLERRAVARRAARAHEVAVQLDHALAARRGVQAVDVLGHEQEPIAERALDLRERAVAGVRHHARHRRAALRVELPDEQGIARESRRRRDVLDPVALPQAAGGAKRRDPALRGDTGAREHEQVTGWIEPQHGDLAIT
jgi:hypothetical protein